VNLLRADRGDGGQLVDVLQCNGHLTVHLVSQLLRMFLFTALVILNSTVDCIQLSFNQTLQLDCKVQLLVIVMLCCLSSVCRLSVTQVYCDKTAEGRFTQFSLKK